MGDAATSGTAISSASTSRSRTVAPCWALGAVRCHDEHASTHLPMVFPSTRGTRIEHSVLKFTGMKLVRETLLGMVDAASVAK